MYTENVTEIIDDLMFDERLPDRESMRQEGIRRLLKSNLGRASDGHKCYYKPDLTEKVMEAARKYFDANARDEEILGFYDDTLFGNANEGILFCTDGMFIREMWSNPVYYPYRHIMSKQIEPSKKKLKLPLSDGGEKEVIICCNKKAMGEMIQQIVELYKRMEERKKKEKEHE